MRKFVTELSFYQQCHTKLITKITHFIGVPLILFSLLIFLGWIHLAVPNLFALNLAWIAILFLLVYYFFLDIPFAVIMTPILIVLCFLASLISQPAITKKGIYIFLTLFFIGWALQLIGHLFERKKPAFTHQFSQILIAPLFLLAEIMLARGYREGLKQKLMQLHEEQNNSM